LPSELFESIFVPRVLREATGDGAWLQALLDAERALAAAEARAGVIPEDAARAIAAACDHATFDPVQLGEQGHRVGNPVEPLVRALRAAAGDAERFVHFGATSQDILDTAAMIVSRRSLAPIVAALDRVAQVCADLAERGRELPIAGRTLLQQALPTTFGLKAAVWLDGVLDARRGLLRVRDERLAVQLGGAVGTLAALGPDVLRLFAEELGLREPVLPWHTNRARVAELGSALAVAAGALAKIGLDVALLAQTEVGEVVPPAGGVSTAVPDKRNPVGSALAIACAREVTAASWVLTAAMAQEHERAVGAWHSEWLALSRALAFTGGAAAAVAETLEGLELRPERMRANLGEEPEAETDALIDRALEEYRRELGR
jgi:3-carboxy-cis,cis-muconate cycloisomerase